MNTQHSHGVGFDRVKLDGGLAADLVSKCRTAATWAVYERFAETGRIGVFDFNWQPGQPHKPHIFWDSDVAKWIEGVAYLLQHQRDEAMEAAVDALVERMERHQQADGYLNIYFTVVEPEARFTRRMDHELYCAGHLIEAAIAYEQATGKGRMLAVMRRYADLIDRVFRIEQSAAFDTCGHEEIELALYKLYRHTGEPRYLALSRFFVDIRGVSQRDIPTKTWDSSYTQSHLPVREQRDAVGHSVRATYLYCAMADLALQTGDAALREACEALFASMTERRMYITGGIGSSHIGEAFTYDYDLPNATAYAETCASIGLALFARRMALIQPRGAYHDAAELALYNGALAGWSLDGKAFFYENPLEADPLQHVHNERRTNPQHMPILQRKVVFDCSCCPPNILRFYASLGDFAYSHTADTLFVHQYFAGRADLPMAGDPTLHVHTAYPWDGQITLTLERPGALRTLALRIPGWCDEYTAAINGLSVQGELRDGYLYLSGDFASGDTVTLALAMPPRRMYAHPAVRENCGRVAVQRGPIVYCAEGVDNGDHLRDIRLRADAPITVDATNTFTAHGGVNLCAPALRTRRQPDAPLYSAQPPALEPCTLRLIPYFAWANRGQNEMTVWLTQA